MPHMKFSCLSRGGTGIIQNPNASPTRPGPALSGGGGMQPVDRSTLKAQLQQDGVEYLLVQFVDVHGAPKVKMVPADALDDVADTGAGFAGGAVWGLGQDPAAHDMMARIDPPSYTPL